MTPDTEEQARYQRSTRPEIALLTNHGYAGTDIPIGGATDTGGQNFYVNTLALKLERLGYRVTIFTRGGFPHFQRETIRCDPEFLSEFVRYIYVPGGGSEFLRKEDIAIALDEEVEWLDEFIRAEATARGCEPWDVYEFLNSHYWDAGVMVSRLVERWRDDMVADAMHRLLDKVVPAAELDTMHRLRHWRAMGEAPGFHLGRLLIHLVSLRDDSLAHQVRAAASSWSTVRRLQPHDENALVDRVLSKVEAHADADPPLQRLIAAEALGQGILGLCPDVDERLKRGLDRVNRHVWTPHSLGELKDYNFHDRDDDIRRSLKFCERRNHERVIASRSHAFVATSSRIAERLWVHYRVPVGDTFYFPPCVDGDVFRPYEVDEVQSTYDYLAERSGLSVDRLKSARIVFETSRMDRTKRKDLLLAAMGQLAPKYEDVVLFIGGGPENELFRSLQEQIEYTPTLHERAFLLHAIPTEHIGPLFSIADVYATASEMEGFGMCVSQAASAATCVVSSDRIPFSVHHASKETMLFPAGDAEAFTVALECVLADDADRERRAQGLREVARVLDWDQKTAEFLDHLRDHGFEIAKGETA